MIRWRLGCALSLLLATSPAVAKPPINESADNELPGQVGPGANIAEPHQHALPSESIIRSTTGDAAAAEASSSFPACGGCNRDWIDCCCAYDWNVFLDWLYVQPRGTDLGLAFPTDAAFGSPLGPTTQLDFDFESGIRWGIAKMIQPCDSWLSFTGTHFNSETNASEVPGPGLTLATLLLVSPNPLTAAAATSSFTRGRGEIDFDTYDFDYSKVLGRAGTCEVTGLLGVRLGALDQDLRVVYDEDTVSSSADLRGAGVRFGVGSRKDSGCWQFYGRSILTVMATDTDLDYQQVNAAAGQVVNFSQNIDRIIPVLDLEIGVGYDVNKKISLSAGYLVSLWFNVVTTPELIQDLQAGDFSGDVEDDLTFDGLFTRIEVRW